MDEEEMGYYQRLGDAIAEIRDLRGLTQPELGRLTGHAASTISKWESAKAKPKAYDLHVIAAALQVPAGLLVDPPEVPESLVRKALHDRSAGAPAPRPRPVVPAATLRGVRRRPSQP